MMMFSEIDREKYAVPKSTALVNLPRGAIDTKYNIEQTIEGFILACINECQMLTESC